MKGCRRVRIKLSSQGQWCGNLKFVCVFTFAGLMDMLTTGMTEPRDILTAHVRRAVDSWRDRAAWVPGDRWLMVTSLLSITTAPCHRLPPAVNCRRSSAAGRERHHYSVCQCTTSPVPASLNEQTSQAFSYSASGLLASGLPEQHALSLRLPSVCLVPAGALRST